MRIIILSLLLSFLSLVCRAYIVSDTLSADSMERDEYRDSMFYIGHAAADSIQRWPQSIQDRLKVLVENPLFEKSQLGLMVYDLTADSMLFEYGGRQTMRPASCEKLVTAITALDLLGGSYCFSTQLYYQGRIDSSTLIGDIYCVAGFDPCFNGDDMNAFVESLKKLKVDTIRGCIIADLSMKDGNYWGEGWCWDDDNCRLTPLLISKKDNFLSRFLNELKKRGIVVDASISESGRVPDGARILCSRFHTIDQVLMRMLKESDNLYAEAMFYQIAAASGARPASARHARQFINQLIRKIGLNPSDYYVADGCGLSLYNYLSPELLVRLLRYAWRSSDIYSHLYPSLPIAGHDGTLKKRMRNGFAKDNVHAKTGTITAVNTLAGYATASNGHALAFAVMNQGLMREASGRAFQNSVCNALCEP